MGTEQVLVTSLSGADLDLNTNFRATNPQTYGHTRVPGGLFLGKIVECVFLSHF